MTATLNPYLNFRDQSREAIEFYHSVFGGELTINTFGDFGMEVELDELNKVMHSQVDAPNGFTLMAADTPNYMEYTVGSHQFAVSLSGAKADEAELRGFWEKLAEGATVTQPLDTAPWGATFGMLDDRFGVSWLVNISAE
jgi:PhnB protein